LSENILNKE